MYKVKTYNNLHPDGLSLLSSSGYTIGEDIDNPSALLLRSHNLHQTPIPQSVAAIARAGAGVNNIPVDELTAQGIPVFNTPGANANAVVELVLAAMLIWSRNLNKSLSFIHSLQGQPASCEFIEKEKKRFLGHELRGQRLLIIGLGAIGSQLANSASAQGMEVLGFDPMLEVGRALSLPSTMTHVTDLDTALAQADYISLHVPLIEATRSLVNAEFLAKCAPNAVLLNFSREAIVDTSAILASLNDGSIGGFATDFPTPELIGHPNTLCFPHLGASTSNAEKNCAQMAAQSLMAYLQYGHITRSVNFQNAELPLADHRLCVFNQNVPNMLAQISSTLGAHELNIKEMLNQSNGEMAYTLIDTDKAPSEKALSALRENPGVIRIRYIDRRTL